MKHIVGFSGGIDSQACALWARQRFPAEDIILLNTNAGEHEHPITNAFVRQYSETVFPVTVVPNLLLDMWKTPEWAESHYGRSGDEPLTFAEMIRIKSRPPSRKAQFCTEILKLRPQRRWVDENVVDDFERYTGVRRDESDQRKDTPLREWDDFFDCYVNHPLVEWKKQQCFDLVRSAGEPINELYTLGFNRVGCSPCVNSGKDDIRAWAERFPERVEYIREIERSTGNTFFSPCVPGIRPRLDSRGKMTVHNWIDEVVEWARTDRGGYQFNILKSQPRPACESKYGLCE